MPISGEKTNPRCGLRYLGKKGSKAIKNSSFRISLTALESREHNVCLLNRPLVMKFSFTSLSLINAPNYNSRILI